MKKISINDLKNKTVHFIGIGGISMSALAQMLFAKNIKVQGSDESNNKEIEKLKKLGIKIFNKHQKDNVFDVDIIVYSSAINESNPEFIYAKEQRLLILKRAELLAIIASNYKTIISVAGSHGKTTTTALISEIFLNANLNPTLHLGGVLNKVKSNYRIGGNEIFITESCEYKDNFLYLKPDISVILNIDADHLDYFKNIENIKKSFYKFSRNTKQGGVNLICADDDNSQILSKSAKNIKFGLNNGDFYVKNAKILKNAEYSFDVYFKKNPLGNIKMSLCGKHNIYNILAAVGVGLVYGIDFDIIKSTIESFSGVERRFQYICDINNAKIFHDYAHHPSQIKSVIEIAKSLVSQKGRIFVFYEPHTYSRTKFLIDDFVKSFIGADYLYLLPAYSAREKESEGFDSDILCAKTKDIKINSKYILTYNEILSEINSKTRGGDIVLILGAGSIDRSLNLLKKL